MLSKAYAREHKVKIIFGTKIYKEDLVCKTSVQYGGSKATPLETSVEAKL